MPHISIKMLKGRTQQQKQATANAVCEALCKELNASPKHVSVTVEDYSAIEWQDVFKREITDKKDFLYKAPQYDPKDLL